MKFSSRLCRQSWVNLLSSRSTSRNVSVHEVKSQVPQPVCNLHSDPVSTLNQSEAAHFRSLSSKWWTGPEFAPLRSMNTLRVPFVVEAFQSGLSLTQPTIQPSSGNTAFRPSLNGVKLLDIGSGGGILSESLARLGATVTGIDPVAENVSVATDHARISFGSNSKKSPYYKCCTIEALSADVSNVNAFDGIVASEVLEHVDNVGHFLEGTVKCLRPGGFLFFTTINQTPLAYFMMICAAENLGLVPKGTHEYRKFVQPEALRLVLQDYNCDVMQVHGMLFNPLSLQWTWTQNQWVNYALMAVKRG